MDVRTLMRRAAQLNADREAIVARDRRLTFAQSWERGVRMANGLIDLGVEPGDRVGVLEDNSLEAADFFVGAAVANSVRVPLYPRNSRAAHLHMLGHTDCRVLVVGESYASDIEGLVDELPSLEHVLLRDAGYEDWLAAQSAVDPELPIDADDNYIIRHTGGTTGPSKGVAYTHRSWLAAGRDWFYTYPPVEPGDKCLHLGPISHGSGYLFVPMWLSGGCNVLEPHFDVEATLSLLERERIAYCFMVPTMLNAVVRHPSARERDFSAMKCLMIGAAPIADNTALAAHEVFGDAMFQGYGQTEALPISMMGPRQWFAEVEGSEPLRSAGLILPFADIEIRDPDGERELPFGEEGEICVRCDGQMSGFWNDPEETERRLKGGWVRTGDIGKIDRNGYLYVLDRKDDMIISGGYNIYPAELENVITDHPAVVEAAVFGIPDERWGETPLAVCVVDGQTPVTESEIISLCGERLGSYKRPGKVVLRTEELPKSPVGKILRKALREPYWKGHSRRVAGN